MAGDFLKKLCTMTHSEIDRLFANVLYVYKCLFKVLLLFFHFLKVLPQKSAVSVCVSKVKAVFLMVWHTSRVEAVVA